MNDNEMANTTQAGDAIQPATREPRSIGEHARQIRQDATSLATEVRDTRNDLERTLTEQMTERPWLTLGMAAGAGYLLGGGLRSRLTVVMLGAATRLATAMAARELGARMTGHQSTPDRNRST